MLNVVVFGSSGYIGGHITEELLARGHSVVGVHRKITDSPARQNFTAHAGSVHDDSYVDEVTKDADAIIVAIPTIPDDQPELASALPSLLNAAARSGARLGVMGGAATLLYREGGPSIMDSPIWDPQWAVEGNAHVRALELLQSYDGPADWFCITPPYGFGPWAPGTRTGVFRVGDDVLLLDSDGQVISVEDLGIAFADELEKPEHHRARFTVGY
jgi:putative NADH-flavin reductase